MPVVVLRRMGLHKNRQLAAFHLVTILLNIPVENRREVDKLSCRSGILSENNAEVSKCTAILLGSIEYDSGYTAVCCALGECVGNGNVEVFRESDRKLGLF